MDKKERIIDPAKERKKIKSVKTMKKIMTDYYIDAKTASQNGKIVAWVSSGAPVEPLIAMDIIPIYPENHAAMIGALKMAPDLHEKAEGMGYSSDLCSYARADISCATVNGGPIGGLPKPDFLIGCNNICGTIMKWYEIQARYFDVPMFIFDTPFIHTEFTEESKVYMRKQQAELIEFLEKITGKKMDMDRMTEVGKLSIQGQRIWQSVLDTTMHSPAPMTAFDAFFHLALIVTLRGTQTVVDYYTQLKEEMDERIKEGIGMVDNEKYRLLWDNLPVWYKTKWLSDKFASHNAALVTDTYTSAWSGVVDLLDENDFLESMIVGYSNIILNTSVDKMFLDLKKMIKKYRIDGVVMHSNRSCKPYSFGQYDLKRMLLEKLDIPTLIIEADMLDERNFSESQIETRIDAFMELLEERKK